MNNAGYIKKILILDDSADYRKLLTTYLNSVFKNTELVEYDPVEKGVPDDSFEWSEYDVLIIDYNLHPNNLTGLDVFIENSKNNEMPTTIMLTGEGNEEIAVRAMKSGIYDYLRKDKLKKELLKISVQEAFNKHNSYNDNHISIDEVRQLAKHEAQTAFAAYKVQYKKIYANKEIRLKTERLKLKNELQQNQAILDEIKNSINEVEQHDSLADKEMLDLKTQQEEAEDAVLKTNWKYGLEEELNLQLEEDLKTFKDEMVQQKKIDLDIMTQMENAKKAKEESMAAAIKDNKNLLNDISSQLNQDDSSSQLT